MKVHEHVRRLTEPKNNQSFKQMGKDVTCGQKIKSFFCLVFLFSLLMAYLVLVVLGHFITFGDWPEIKNPNLLQKKVMLEIHGYTDLASWLFALFFYFALRFNK